jgi:hypothetical protein
VSNIFEDVPASDSDGGCYIIIRMLLDSILVYNGNPTFRTGDLIEHTVNWPRFALDAFKLQILEY